MRQVNAAVAVRCRLRGGLNCFALIAWMFCLQLERSAFAEGAARAEVNQPELLFKVTFDDLTANAEVAKGNPKSTLDRDLGLTAKTGVKNAALLLGDDEKCGYEVKGNLDLSAGTISFWAKPYNWQDNEGRYQKFFWVYGREKGTPFSFYIDSPNNPNDARLVMSFGGSRTPNYKLYQINAKADWRSGKWHKIDVTWDSRHIAIYVNGRLGEKQELRDVTFPKLEDRKFHLTPLYHHGEGRYHNKKDRSLIDEFEIWRGVLSADRILQRYLADTGGVLPPPTLRVPRAATAIEIDGRLEEGAWKSASRAPIPIDATSMFPSSIWAYASVCYDDENLYVGFHSPKKKAKLAANAERRDGNVWEDDAFELFLTPDLSRKKDFFQWVANSKAAVFDARYGRREWTSRAAFKARVASNYWTVEAAVPFNDLGAAVPKPGDVWLGNFCRDWFRSPPANPVYTSWAYPEGGFLAHPERYGKLIFGGDAVGARLSISPMLNVGKLDLSVSTDASSTAAVSVKSGAATVFERSQTVERETRFKTRLKGVKEGVLSVEIKDEDGEALAYSMRFMVKEPIEIAYLPDPPKEQLGLEINLANVDADWLLPIASGRATLEVSFKGPKKDQGNSAFSLVGLTETFWIPFHYEVGDYEMTYRLREPEHAQALTMEKTLEIPPLPWVGTKVGVTDEVLEPWTPLEYEDSSTVLCWGRKYVFDGPFLRGAINQERNILSGPIRMTMRAGNGLADLTSIKSETVRKDSNRAEFKGTGQFGETGVSLNWTMWMEYDGLTVAAVTLEPPKNGFSIEGLSLKAPIRKDVVKYIRGTRQMGGLKSGRIKWDGKRWESDFQPYIWVTNEDEGFLYFCESEANWVYPRKAKVVVVRGGQHAGIELKLISKAVAVTKPLTYTFGFQATPVKPMMKERRAWNFGMAKLAKRQNARNWMTGYAVQDGTWQVARPEVLRKFDQNLRAKGVKMLYYGVTSCTPDHNPTYDLYKKLWSSNYSASFGPYIQKATAFREARPPYRLASVCPGSPTFQDFMLYYADEMLRETGAPGLYTDTDGVWACDSTYHGCGFTDVFGKRGVTYTILKKRRFAKRLAAIMRRVGGERRYWMTHAHAKLAPPVHCWADFWLPGEENTHQLRGNKWFYIDTLDDVAWRVEYHGKSSGLVHTFLPEFVRGTKDKTDMGGPQPTESLLAMCAVTDVNATGAYLNIEAIGEFWDLRKRLEIVHADFIGYWLEDCPVKATTDKALASVYRSKNIISIPIANRLPEDSEITVSVNLDALGLAGKKVKAIDERAGKSVDIKGGAFTVPVRARNYTFVSLRQE